MKTQFQFATIMDLGKLTKEFLQAHINALKLEAESKLKKDIKFKKVEETKKTKNKRKITFGKVTIVDSKQTQIVDIKDATESSKLGKVKSAPFIEKYIAQLLIYTEPFDWHKSPCGTLASLKEHLVKENLEFETLYRDLRKIYKDFTKFQSSILGYKGSWTFKKMQKKLVPGKNYFTGNVEWVDIGLQVNVEPILKLYLSKVIQDGLLASVDDESPALKKLRTLGFSDRTAREAILKCGEDVSQEVALHVGDKHKNLASIIIQRNWRRKKIQINIKAKEKFLLECAYIATPPEARAAFCAKNPKFQQISPYQVQSDDEEDLYS